MDSGMEKGLKVAFSYALYTEHGLLLIYVKYFKSTLVCWGAPGSPIDLYSDLQHCYHFCVQWELKSLSIFFSKKNHVH